MTTFRLVLRQVGFVVVTTGFVLSVAPQASAAEAHALPAGQIVEDLRAGRAVDLQDVTVEGNLDLTGAGPVNAPLRCQRCRIGGDIRARDVTFARMVDLSGSRVEGRVDLVGARFEESVLFSRFDDDRTVFAGPVAAAQASFDDQAAFDSADFLGTVDFSATRFAGETSIASARFRRRARFVGTSIHRAFDATVVQFADDADFTRVDFLGGALFIGATFLRPVDFDFARVDGSFDASGEHSSTR